jgi:hypothetical protein
MHFSLVQIDAVLSAAFSNNYLINYDSKNAPPYVVSLYVAIFKNLTHSLKEDLLPFGNIQWNM